MAISYQTAVSVSFPPQTQEGTNMVETSDTFAVADRRNNFESQSLGWKVELSLGGLVTRMHEVPDTTHSTTHKQITLL